MGKISAIPYKDRVSELVRATFLGFIIASIVIIIHPELQNSVVVMYGFLSGKNAIEAHLKSKIIGKNKIESNRGE
jgi:hypothetical protein